MSTRVRTEVGRQRSSRGGCACGHSTGRVAAAPPLLLLLPVLVIAAVACAGVHRAWAEKSMESRTSPAVAKTTPTPEGTCELLLTLKAEGFEPAEVEATAGTCLLSVDNQSGVREVTLRLAHEGGAHVRDIPVPPDAVDWGAELELVSGAYALTVAGRPEWACRIVVQ